MESNAECIAEMNNEETTHQLNTLDSELSKLRAENAMLRDDNARMLAGAFTAEELQGFCHTLTKEDKCAFFDGCAEYQKRLFGECDRDTLVSRDVLEKTADILNDALWVIQTWTKPGDQIRADIQNALTLARAELERAEYRAE